MQKLYRWSGAALLLLCGSIAPWSVPWAAPTTTTTATPGQAQVNLSEPIPIDPQIKVGHLDNGLTYYIRKNARPEKRLELRLVVKAGSVLEDDDQRGLAHYTEHMAFNGSTHFKKHELISYLQSIGVKFGADLNAYTSFNETVYMLPLPTDSREAVEKGFLVLEDWAHGILFNDADVAAERAIILEEWRRGLGARERINRVVYPKVFEGTPYAQRMPIGTQESLNSFQFDALKRFYKDWYRPDLMAVVVVGDIELADAQVLIEKHFSSLKNPPHPRPRLYPHMPVRTESQALVVTDKEETNNILQILSPVVEDKTVVTLGDQRQKHIELLFGMMLGQRMGELTQQANPPFIAGNSTLSGLMRGYKAYTSFAVLGRLGADAAIDALAKENARARQFGFSAAELERAKKNILRSLEQGNAERDKSNSADYAAEYIRNFLVQEVIPGISNELRYAQMLLPTISLADINTYAAQVIPDKAAQLVVYTGTDKADSNTPTEAQLLAAVNLAQQQSVQAKVEKELGTSLMTKLPTAGKIVSEHVDAALGTTEWTLSNGLRVIFKPTDFKNDEIVLGATRFGGQSLFGLEDKYQASYALSLATVMGLGDYSPTDLQKILAGKVAVARVGMDTLDEKIDGFSSQADLETMFQMLYLRFTPVRQDPALFTSSISRAVDSVKDALARPEAVFNDAVSSTLYNNHPRLALTPRPSDFAGLTLQRTSAIVDQRFASAKGFTIVMAGSTTPEVLKPLVERYLASLPTPEIATQFVDLGIRPVQGVVKKEVFAGTEPKSIASITFSGTAAYSDAQSLRMNALVDVLNNTITEVLREKLTLIYSGGIGGQLHRIPYEHYELRLNLPCSPENADKAVAAALAEIKKLQDTGPQMQDLDKVKKNWLVNHRRNLRENGYWMNNLRYDALYGDDSHELLNYEKDVDAITLQDVQAAAKRYLPLDNYVQVVLKPATTQAK